MSEFFVEDALWLENQQDTRGNDENNLQVSEKTPVPTEEVLSTTGLVFAALLSFFSGNSKWRRQDVSPYSSACQSAAERAEVADRLSLAHAIQKYDSSRSVLQCIPKVTL